ncbi:bcl-2/adenovirus E1B 19 kDa-interacting protein 2-like protein isoform X2 [Salvelinus fontinalis]|uniref:bcl-2/adenovirus E1B 19 kDa-interacting protein 2-like protein isoform X2 n=1 Tax=Salvelinus fontinalis TaxID=8038 RepID=UPI002484D836|nr:bcl-2/adenovirus E1B 19 kDa-interacting protein 2-like protein isoform X2 [Salvelinus fontinalis]
MSARLYRGKGERSPEGAKAASYIQDMELREEWQDEEFPRPLPEDSHSPETQGENAERPAPPTSLALSENPIRKKRLVAPTLSLTLSRTDSADRSVRSGDTGYSAAALSPDEDDTELDINLEALETPSDSESCNFPDSMHELEWEDDLPRLGRGEDGVSGTTVMEQAEMGSMELDQVDNRGRRWRRFCVTGQEYHVNMSVLEPYLQVLSHGGYYGEAMNAIITFSSCYLPENTVENYEYVMDNLFRYIVGTLDLMVSEGYVMVYLCSMAPRNKMPAIKWLRQCYTSIDRRYSTFLLLFLSQGSLCCCTERVQRRGQVALCIALLWSRNWTEWEDVMGGLLFLSYLCFSSPSVEYHRNAIMIQGCEDLYHRVV